MIACQEPGMVEAPVVVPCQPPVATMLSDLALSQYADRLLPAGMEEARREFDKQAQELFQSIAGPCPNTLESLLAERIVICHTALHEQETQFGQLGQGMNSRQREAWEKSISRLQVRYLAAIKALAQIRRLNLPAVQVNIGQSQTNVAGVAVGNVAAQQLPNAASTS